MAEPESRTRTGDRSFSFDCLRFHLAFLYRSESAEALHDQFGDLEKIFELIRRRGSPAEEETVGKLCERLRDPEWEARARQELGHCSRNGVTVSTPAGDDWPQALCGLPHMPAVLFSRGTLLARDRFAVAIVGTRRPSPYGIRQARRFASELGQAGITVVSGLARGIDREAHAAAIEAGGRTIAVLGSGLGKIYPREHRSLARRIVESGQGALISEFPYHAAPLRHHFPQRNRIISALASGLLVVEAGRKSGSLITVDWSLRQGKQVCAVPGRIDEPEAAGCLHLIQSGAHPVGGATELVEMLFGHNLPEKLTASGLADSIGRAVPESPGEDPFLSRLGSLFEVRDAWHPDEICEALGMDASVVLGELGRLESAGRLRRWRAGRFILIR